MGKSTLFIGFTFSLILVLVFFIYFSSMRQIRWHEELEGQHELVRQLSLTDFAIWTEARYTRHPTQADFFSPFQDFPSSIEHFPAGSVIAPVYSAEGSR